MRRNKTFFNHSQTTPLPPPPQLLQRISKVLRFKKDLDSTENPTIIPFQTINWFLFNTFSTIKKYLTALGLCILHFEFKIYKF